jgi:Flp pilus assembly pilin Flp
MGIFAFPAQVDAGSGPKDASGGAMRPTIHDDAGATMVEYGFVLLFIVLATLAAIRLLGLDVLAMFQPAADAMP